MKALFSEKPLEIQYMLLPDGKADVWLRTNIEMSTEVVNDIEQEVWTADEEYFRTSMSKEEVEEQFEQKKKQESVVYDFEVMQNTFDSYFFDGLKIVADPDHPVSLVLPMKVIANVFYKQNDSVFVATKTGVAKELSYEWFEWWSGPNPFENETE